MQMTDENVLVHTNDMTKAQVFSYVNSISVNVVCGNDSF